VEGWIVQVYLRLRDPRVLVQSMSSADAMQSLGAAIESNSSVRFVISGMSLFEAEWHLPLLRRENAWFEVSHLQHPMAPLDKLAEKIGASRMLFGTNVPFFYPFVTTFRTMHSNLSQEEMSCMLSGNAVNLLVV
jgi:predicted TIM-barrel fold metal-dependent hydrolase